jgi:hypothetical protein
VTSNSIVNLVSRGDLTLPVALAKPRKVTLPLSSSTKPGSTVTTVL